MSPGKQYLETEQLLEQARQLRETAKRLLEKSDALLEEFQRLSGKQPKMKARVSKEA
jgi:hypothetical protein